MDNKKVIFLLATISQPRCIKRIKSFIQNGYVVEVYGFNRGVYNVNTYIEGVKVNDLGFVPSGSGYIKKFLSAKKSLKKIFKKYQSQNVMYYAFSFDLALICKLFSKTKYIYEISDLVYTYFGNQKVINFFKLIDKWIIKKSYLTIMTSEGFYNYFYPDKDVENVIVQANKVNANLKDIIRDLKEIQSANKLIFSYVGAFRYPNTVFRFAKIIGEKYPEHEFSFWGDSILTPMAKEFAEKYKNVNYLGAFKNPEDLEKIYSSIDIVVACYDIKTLNERIAEPNKLYEALLFKKPIVVSKETFLEEKVLDLKSGFAIDATSDIAISTFIDNLSMEKLNSIKSEIEKVPLEEIVDDNAKMIINYIKNTE